MLPPEARTGELGTSFYAVKARHGAARRGVRLPKDAGPCLHNLVPLERLPKCMDLMRRAEQAFGVAPRDAKLLNGLARRYFPRGRGLPRHIDDPMMFQEPILSLVLQVGGTDGLRLSEIDSTVVAQAEGVALRMQRRFHVQEAPGLAVCLQGHARYELMHEVQPVETPRVSLTWRWFRQDFLDALDAEPAPQMAIAT